MPGPQGISLNCKTGPRQFWDGSGSPWIFGGGRTLYAARMQEIRTVGIIGAGIAGLATAKVLRQLGFAVSVLEKEADVGGVWSASRRYPGLTTQNPRETYEFSDFPMPRHYPEWPTGEQVQSYLHSYAEKFGLMAHIQLHTRVENARWDPAGKQWVLDTSDSMGITGVAKDERRFDYLIVCNGIFSTPFVPEFPGAAQFVAAGGRICHTSQFTALEDARGKHVVVIGYGKSSCDAANAVSAISATTTVVARNLIWKIPKKIANTLNFKYLFLTRMGEGLFRYIRVKGFERFLHGPGRPLRNSMLKSVERVVSRQLRLNELGLHPGKPLETIARSTVSLVTDGFYEGLGDGRIRMQPRASIARLDAGTMTLSNGANLPADVLICGTGWIQHVPFLDAVVRARVTDTQGNFRLYRSMLPVDVPQLAFNGYNSSFFSQLNAEVGALWLGAHLKGLIELPGREAMNADIDVRLRWMEERTDGKHSKGTNIIPFSLHQIDELLHDMQLELPWWLRLRQWFVPVVGAHFRALTPRLMRKLST